MTRKSLGLTRLISSQNQSYSPKTGNARRQGARGGPREGRRGRKTFEGGRDGRQFAVGGGGGRRRLLGAGAVAVHVDAVHELGQQLLPRLFSRTRRRRQRRRRRRRRRLGGGVQDAADARHGAGRGQLPLLLLLLLLQLALLEEVARRLVDVASVGRQRPVRALHHLVQVAGQQPLHRMAHEHELEVRGVQQLELGQRLCPR